MATVKRAINYIVRGKRFTIPSTTITSLSPYDFGSRIICRTASNQKTVVKVEGNPRHGQVSTTFGKVVKENTASAWYVTVILAGVGATTLILYTIFRELFSDKSPNSIYSKALDRLTQDPKVADALGEPIKSHGEENRRGRRRYVNHTIFMHNGRQHMRMQFYVQGLRKRGTVYLEVEENNSGNYEYRYLFIELDDMFHTVIVVEDNRASGTQTDKIDLHRSPSPSHLPQIDEL